MSAGTIDSILVGNRVENAGLGSNRLGLVNDRTTGAIAPAYLAKVHYTALAVQYQDHSY
jgi:hypothetical protein